MAAEAPPVPGASPNPLGATPVRFVLYRDKQSTSAVPISTDWAGFVEFLSMVEESPCSVVDGDVKRCIGKECPHKAFSSLPDNYMAWSPVVIQGPRLDVNVREITLLVFDFDHITEDQLADIRARLAPYEHVEHTTHTNRDGDLALRAVLLPSRTVSADQFHRFLRGAVGMLQVPADPVCKNRSRYYYRPSHPRGAQYWVRECRGRALSVDEVLAFESAMPAPPIVQREARASGVEDGDWDLNSDHVVEAIDLMARYFPPRRRNELCLALGGILRAHGASEQDAFYIVYEICVQGGSTDPDARAKTVEHTYALSDDSAMTGMTRAIDILGDFLGAEEGERVAKEFGDHLTRVANETYLSNLARDPEMRSVVEEWRESPTLPLAPAVTPDGMSGAAPPVAPPVVPPSVTDLAEVRRSIQKLATKRDRSLDRDDKIMAVLLRRVTNGEALAQPGGAGDVETVRDGATAGLAPLDAIAKVAGALAFSLDLTVLAEDAAEVARRSLQSIAVPPTGASDWVEVFKGAYRLSQETRRVAEIKRAAQNERAKRRSMAALSLPPDDGKWKDELRKRPDGAIAVSPFNLGVIFDNDPGLRGSVRWNEYAKRMEIVGGVLAEHAASGERVAAVKAREYLSQSLEIVVSRQEVEDQLLLHAWRNSYDPLMDYLRSRQWDGVERADTFLIRYFGVPDTAHTRRISRRWLIGAVARGLEPGCKFDNVLVFQGLQGKKKTSAFNALGGSFYTSSSIDIRDKDSKMLAARCWIVELAELEAVRKTETPLQRAFLTQQFDLYRPPYAASMVETPRRAVFVGSENEEQFLSDTTGNRRWWPMTCGVVDVAGLLRDRDQIWAEAVALFLAHEYCPDCLSSEDTVFGQKPRCKDHRWWLSEAEEGEARVAVAEYEEERPSMVWEEKILQWWRTQSRRPRSVTVAQIALEVGELPIDRASARHVRTEIGIALRAVGFRRNPSQRCWVPGDDLMAMAPGRSLFSIPGGRADEDKR